MGLKSSACEMPKTINPNEFIECATEGSGCVCDGIMAFS